MRQRDGPTAMRVDFVKVNFADKLEAATKEKCAAESDLRRERAKLDSYSVDISILGD